VCLERIIGETYTGSVADFMSREERSAHMAKIRSKDTKPELLLRHALHESGYRYRIHDRRLPGRPDLVFPRRKKVIFVHGCFWHGHNCPVGARLPKSNTEFWEQKRLKNRARDVQQLGNLAALGWEALVVWECDLIPEPTKVQEEITGFLGPPRITPVRSRRGDAEVS
jgi:DNA mismatch endonuclease (patch repair protein)